MFNGLPLKQSVVDQAGVPTAKGRLYSLSGNLLVGTGNRPKSIYLIGGGGWYRRTVEAKATKLQAGEICEPLWGFWGVECVNGIFPTSVTIASYTSSAPGFNIGGGFTYALGESGAHLYTEIRYHHAFTRSIDTTVLPLTFGIRF